MSAHSPMPWRFEITDNDSPLLLDADGNVLLCLDDHLSPAYDFHFVVKCVNMHDELVAVLPDARRIISQLRDVQNHFKTGLGDQHNETLSRIEALLAKAKGEA